MSTPPSDATLTPAASARPSPVVAFWVLVVLSFQRHWRVRQMALVSIGLLLMVVAWVLVVTLRPSGWGLPDRNVRRGGPTFRVAAERLIVQPGDGFGFAIFGAPTPYLVPVLSYEMLVRSVPHAVVSSDPLMDRWAYMTFSRWVVVAGFLGFVLPLFTLSYATAAFGTERESRSLVWVMTRPIPRSAIYLAKFLGTLPWCVAFGLGGFVALCLAGGEHGGRALRMYWPAAAAGTVAFAALFHFIGAIFRRPVVVGLVYVFFFEALVAALPGSLKLLSLTFYLRCLMYNAAQSAGCPAGMLEVSQPESAGTAWTFLLAVTFGLTALGMWLFARSEYRDDL